MTKPYRSKERSPIELSYLLRAIAPESTQEFDLVLPVEVFNGTKEHEILIHITNGGMASKNSDRINRSEKASVDYFVDFIATHPSFCSLKKLTGRLSACNVCVIGTEMTHDSHGIAFYPVAWYSTSEPRVAPIPAKLADFKEIDEQTICVFLYLK